MTNFKATIEDLTWTTEKVTYDNSLTTGMDNVPKAVNEKGIYSLSNYGYRKK